MENNKKIDFNQTKINFDQPKVEEKIIEEKKEVEDLEKERDEVAKKYKVGNKDKLKKITGRWFYVENNTYKPIEDWDKEMEILFAKNPNDQLRGF